MNFFGVLPLLSGRFRSTGMKNLERSISMLSFALAAMALAGCGSVVKPAISPIEFTTAAGASAPALTSLPVNGQAYFVASVTHDNQFLGVSWTVACGSAAPPSPNTIDTSCGIFNPSQTASGPVPTYPTPGIVFVAAYTAPPTIPKGKTVTITAHATSLPSVSSSVTLTIVNAASTGELEPVQSE